MNSAWRNARLGEFLTERKEFFGINDFTLYKRARNQWYGKGIILRDQIWGSEIKTKEQKFIREGEFVVAEIDAKEGSFGIVPPDLDGAIVSSHYFVFQINERICLRSWLDLVSKANLFQPQVVAQGSTNYSAVRPNQILEFTIPLPPLDEQRRIVARIEAMAEPVHKAKQLRSEAVKESKALLGTIIHEYFVVRSNDWKSIPMTQAITINSKQVDPTLPKYACLPHINGENINSKTCELLPYRTAEEDGVRSKKYLFSPDTILYSKIRPYLQKAVYIDFYGVCSADIYPIKVINEKLDSKFVMWSLVAEPFTDYANRLSGRTRMPKLNRKQLFGFTIRFPSIEQQREIVICLDSMQSTINKMTNLHIKTQKELDSLMPSILDKAFKGEL